jgi:D-amino-acid oxidase
MADGQHDVLVIGAGVSGLTTGICLAEAGLSVLIRAQWPPADTTSAVAGALWGMHLVERSERALGWGRDTLAELTALAASAAASGTGVRVVNGVQVSLPGAAPPDWAGLLGTFRPCHAGELPAGYQDGWRFAAPVVDMPVYLDYLLDRFREAGGTTETGVAGSLADAGRGRLAVVNCSGAGARDLVPDPLVTPVRGQIVVVANPGLDEFFVDDSGPPADLLYFVPHARRVVLGGTSERGRSDLSPDPRTAARILGRCAAVEPRLRGAEVIAHRVGLRPARPTVRTEAQRLPGGPLLCHNYGHGGAGVTLSWGCAREVAALVLRGQDVTG